MKMKIIKSVVFVVFVLIAGLNVYKANAEKELSDIQVKNVEALATGEKPPFENWGGHALTEIKPGCVMCKKTKPEDWCDIHGQIPC